MYLYFERVKKVGERYVIGVFFKFVWEYEVNFLKNFLVLSRCCSIYMFILLW